MKDKKQEDIIKEDYQAILIKTITFFLEIPE